MSINIWIDPGTASADVVADIMKAIRAVYQAAGGDDLSFAVIGDHEYGCTGVAARWCPVHGSCTDSRLSEERPIPSRPYSDHCDDAQCPLHGVASSHAGPPAEGL